MKKVPGLPLKCCLQRYLRKELRNLQQEKSEKKTPANVLQVVEFEEERDLWQPKIYLTSEMYCVLLKRDILFGNTYMLTMLKCSAILNCVI